MNQDTNAKGGRSGQKMSGFGKRSSSGDRNPSKGGGRGSAGGSGGG